MADRNVLEVHPPPVDAPTIALPPQKDLANWQRILDALVAARVDRDGLVYAFGGGTVLDMAGFAAACYLRGVRWIAVPTTLLAMVDAAWGGKTGVDHPAGKNLVGAFHEPQEVVVETDYLATLPEAEVRNGLAEVVKHGVIGDPTLLDRAGRDDPATLVHDASLVKREIVQRDPLERDERRRLNLGHTLGHAIETAAGIPHGEAVALGLRAACRIAEEHCGFADGARVEEALDRCGLPQETNADIAAVQSAIAHDKKRRGATLRWALPVALGEVRIFDEVPDELVWRISKPLCLS